MAFFLLVDLLVLIVTVGAYIPLHDTWVNCNINFDQWCTAIMIFIGFSLLLAVMQFYLRKRMKTYIDEAERAALKSSVESFKDIEIDTPGYRESLVNGEQENY